MRTFLVFAAVSVLVLSSAACEKTVQEARSPMSRQQLRKPSTASRSTPSRQARSRTLTPVQAQQARATPQRRPAVSALRMPRVMQPLRTSSQQAMARQSARQRQAKLSPTPGLAKTQKPKNDLLELSKEVLSKAWLLLL